MTVHHDFKLEKNASLNLRVRGLPQSMASETYTSVSTPIQYDNRVLCRRLLEDTGVAILPGVVFERPREELTARVTYVNFDGAGALAASETIPLDQELPDEFIRQCCRDVVDGVERIAEWLEKKE